MLNHLTPQQFFQIRIADAGGMVLATAQPEAHGALSMLDLALMTAAGVSVLVLILRGCMKRDVFDGVPLRGTSLRPIDMVVGLFLMLLGMQVFGVVVSRAVWFERLSPAEQSVWTAYLGQGLTQLPVVGWLLWRTGMTRQGLREVGVISSGFGRDLKLTIFGVCAGIPLVMGLVTLVVWGSRWWGIPAPDFGHPVLEVINDTKSIGIVYGHAVSAVILAPVFEECIFRGLVQTSLLTRAGMMHRWQVILISASLFTLVHVGLPWQVLPSLFVLAVWLGWVYERSGSLWPVILIHAGFNAFNFIMATTLGPN